MGKIIYIQSTLTKMMEDNNEESDEIEHSIVDNKTRLSVDMAGISIDVETQGQEECEALFNRTWDKVLDDAEGMSDALSERMNSL